MKPSRWRLAAAAFIVAAVVAAGAMLTPPYLRNFRLQHFLEEELRRPESVDRSAEQWGAVVAAKAGELGLPLRPEQVRVHRSGESLRVEARYPVRVDLLFYTVDLHLLARGGW